MSTVDSDQGCLRCRSPPTTCGDQSRNRRNYQTEDSRNEGLTPGEVQIPSIGVFYLSLLQVAGTDLVG